MVFGEHSWIAGDCNYDKRRTNEGTRIFFKSRSASRKFPESEQRFTRECFERADSSRYDMSESALYESNYEDLYSTPGRNYDRLQRSYAGRHSPSPGRMDSYGGSYLPRYGLERPSMSQAQSEFFTRPAQPFDQNVAEMMNPSSMIPMKSCPTPQRDSRSPPGPRRFRSDERRERRKDFDNLLESSREVIPDGRDPSWHQDSFRSTLSKPPMRARLSSPTHNQRVSSHEYKHLMKELEFYRTNFYKVNCEYEDMKQKQNQKIEEQKAESAQNTKVTAGSPKETDDGFLAFPKYEDIVFNSVISQLELYFTYNYLKRDKNLLGKLVEDKENNLCKLPLTDLKKLSKVRSLTSDEKLIRKAIKESKYLKLIEEKGSKWVARTFFEPPQPQAFPFRKSVFVSGISLKDDKAWIKEYFSCFGKIEKIEFDSDVTNEEAAMRRKISVQLMKEQSNKISSLRVVKDNKGYDYKHYRQTVSSPDEKGATFHCPCCKKEKDAAHGCYVCPTVPQKYLSNDLKIEEHIKDLEKMETGTKHLHPVMCMQCSSKTAEDNQKVYDKKYSESTSLAAKDRLKELYGASDYSVKNEDEFQTCLIVFESQRQASRCVYVRSRLSLGDTFSSHYHRFVRVRRQLFPSSVEPNKRNEIQCQTKACPIPSPIPEEEAARRYVGLDLYKNISIH